MSQKVSLMPVEVLGNKRKRAIPGIIQVEGGESLPQSEKLPDMDVWSKFERYLSEEKRMKEKEQERFVHPDDVDDDTSLALSAYQVLYFKGKRAKRIRATALCSKQKKVPYSKLKRSSDAGEQIVKRKKQLRRERFTRSEEYCQW